MKQSLQSRCSGTPQDRVGRKVGRGVQNCGGCLYTCGWFMLMYGKPSQYCKVIILQLKYINFLKICFSLNTLLFLLYFLQFHYDMSDCEFLLFVFWGVCQSILNVVFNLSWKCFTRFKFIYLFHQILFHYLLNSLRLQRICLKIYLDILDNSVGKVVLFCN